MFLRQKLLETALKHANSVGWREELLIHSIQQHNLSPAVSRGLFPDGVTEVIEHLMKRWEEQLSLDVLDMKLESLTLNEKLYTVLRKRLEYEIPYMPRWREAMILGLYPPHILDTTNTLHSLMNTVWNIVENQEQANVRNMQIHRSIQNWVLRDLYASTEFFMTHDGSENYERTWTLLSDLLRNLDFNSVRCMQVGGIPSFYLLGSYKLLKYNY